VQRFDSAFSLGVANEAAHQPELDVNVAGNVVYGILTIFYFNRFDATIFLIQKQVSMCDAE
jgi:hypothetical protein